MSRHLLHLVRRGRKLTVVAGYDRPLRELFVHVVWDDTSCGQEEAFLYDSVLEPGMDWSDVNTVADKLAALGIEAPESLFEGIFLDQCFNAGNRVVEHFADRPPAVLHAG